MTDAGDDSGVEAKVALIPLTPALSTPIALTPSPSPLPENPHPAFGHPLPSDGRGNIRWARVAEERERDVPRWGESARVGFANSRSRVPPLLGGEGRGEGKTDDPTAECVTIVASAGGWPEGPNGFEPFLLGKQARA